MSVQEVLAVANSPFGGALGMMALGLTLFFLGKLHGPKEFDREVARGDRWQEVALNALQAAKDGASANELAVSLVTAMQAKK